MNRDYDSGIADNVNIFTGVEVEKTPAFGMKTVFVVGVKHDSEHIIDLAQAAGASHVYLGANHSFNGEDLELWDTLAKACLYAGLWVTLDFDVKYVESVADMLLGENHKFIAQMSVKVPYVNQFGYNACIKIDDKDFAATNPGVWVHQLHDLLDRNKFNDWTKYTSDQILE